MAERAVQGGYVSNDGITGGDGGAGGAGGDLTVRFGGTFVPDQITGLLATFGLVTNSFGGQGGDGGKNDIYGTYEKVAGDGGAGGSGGSVTLVADGDIRALASGVEVRSIGGAGGAGADSFTTNDFVDTTQGGAGGNGGMGGTASLQWLSGTVQSTGFGLRATAGGGVGGNGGNSGIFCCTDSNGGDGGAGGNGGTAGVLLSGGAITVTQTLGAVTGIYVDANGGDGGAGGVAGQGNWRWGRQWRHWREWRNRQRHHPGHGDFEWVSRRRSDKWAGGPGPSQWRRRRPRWGQPARGLRPGRWRRVCGRRR